MDARRLRLPCQVIMNQSHQSWKLHRLANAQQMQRGQVLSRDHRDPKGAYEPKQEESPINQAQAQAVGRSRHKDVATKKMRDIYTKVCWVRNTVFSDQTGQFPTRSKRGTKYIMVMVEIDSNAILVEPLKSRKDPEPDKQFLLPVCAPPPKNLLNFAHK